MQTLRNATSGPKRGSTAAYTADDLGLTLDDVVVVMACNEAFVPYLSVSLQSLVEHTNPKRNYDVVVLANGLSADSICRLTAQVARENIGIGFLDAAPRLGSARLPRHGHFSYETYCRLFAHELLPTVDKAVYLDCDLVVLHDVAELFDTNVEGCLLAATRDADTAGQCAGYDELAYTYLRDTLGLSDPYNYFQAGVLVMNLAAFRRRWPTRHALILAASNHWHWLDQDVLNILAGEEYVRLDTSWNTLTDWQGLRRGVIVAQAPAHIQAEYEQARHRPKIVHYAGPDDRPWLYPTCDLGEYFWNYAQRCPYLGELELQLRRSRTTPRGLFKRFQVFALFKVGMPLFDIAFPPKTSRRRTAISCFKQVAKSYV